MKLTMVISSEVLYGSIFVMYIAIFIVIGGLLVMRKNRRDNLKHAETKDILLEDENRKKAGEEGEETEKTKGESVEKSQSESIVRTRSRAKKVE